MLHENSKLMDKWVGQLAVVTGASAGIGAAIVKDLARNGINVIGLARRDDKIEKFLESTEGFGKVYARKCDISDLNSVREAFKWIEEKFGSISILINNAAIFTTRNILDEDDSTAEEINRIINTNLNGAVYCSRESVRLMKKSDGHGMIININSTLGLSVPFIEYAKSVYPATKFALTALSEVLRQELILQDNLKIRVTNLSPGLVKTDVLVAAGGDPNVDHYAGKAHLFAENVAGAVLYLLTTPYNVNITQLTIKPVGERFA